MKTSFKSILLFLLVISLTKVNAQTLQQDFTNVLKNLMKKNNYLQNNSSRKSTLPATTSEFKLLLFGSLKLYQDMISSQDLSVCNFTPSCSHFSSLAFKKAGFFKGMLLTSDRLQRCNGFASFSHSYKYSPQKGKYIDPVERYLSIGKRGK